MHEPAGPEPRGFDGAARPHLVACDAVGASECSELGISLEAHQQAPSLLARLAPPRVAVEVPVSKRARLAIRRYGGHFMTLLFLMAVGTACGLFILVNQRLPHPV